MCDGCRAGARQAADWIARSTVGSSIVSTRPDELERAADRGAVLARVSHPLGVCVGCNLVGMMAAHQPPIRELQFAIVGVTIEPQHLISLAQRRAASAGVENRQRVLLPLAVRRSRSPAATPSSTVHCGNPSRGFRLPTPSHTKTRARVRSTRRGRLTSSRQVRANGAKSKPGILPGREAADRTPTVRDAEP